jgi:hypothetical protein
MLLDFWRWSAYDLVSNATRGVLAEYSVATALGIADGVRSEWNSFDLLTKDGIKIKVKSAAYLQSWGHEERSKIIFGIRPTRLWSSTDGTTEAEAKRQANVYVFCLFKHDDKDSLDPLDLDQWEFYLLRASVLDERSS